MALDKNDGVFLSSIEGVISGRTSQVDGMNGIMNNIQGNCNYLKKEVDFKVSKGGDTITGNLNIKTNNYPSLHLDNTANGYNKALRIEHSQSNLLRFIKYTDIGTGTQDKVLDWDMSVGGTIYHTGNKPTKADVGLSNVMNYGISSAIDSDSETQYANSKAVKTAYSRASTAIDNANGRVSKSGDTMTGELRVPSPFYVGGINIIGTSDSVTRFGDANRQLNLNCKDGLAFVSAWRLYHQGFKPTPSDIGTYSSTEINNTFSKGKGKLPTFNGTFGDFNTRISNGVYYIDANNFNQLGLPSGTYNYGILIVNKSDGNPVNVIYISDGTQNVYTLDVFNFTNRPSDTFVADRWYKIYTSRSKPTATDVGLGNVSNVAQVTDIRMSGNTKVTTWDKAIDTYASGRVQTGSWKDTSGENLDGVYYAALQKCVNGTWYTVATS